MLPPLQLNHSNNLLCKQVPFFFFLATTTSCKLSDEEADDKRYARESLSARFHEPRDPVWELQPCVPSGNGAGATLCSSRLTRGACSDWETCEASVLGGATVCSPDLQDCTPIAKRGETLTLPCVTRRKPWTTFICTKTPGDFEVAFPCASGTAAQPLCNYDSTPLAITLQITRIGFPLSSRGRFEVLHKYWLGAHFCSYRDDLRPRRSNASGAGSHCEGAHWVSMCPLVWSWVWNSWYNLHIVFISCHIKRMSLCALCTSVNKKNPEKRNKRCFTEMC